MAAQPFTKRLASGYDMPALGYGTYETPSDDAQRAVALALKHGYRQIDTAAFYQNESGCGAAVLASGIPRAEVFYTTKLPPPSMGYEKTKEAIASSLQQSGLRYLDLYLIHAPFGNTEQRNGSWQAMVEAVERGQIRSIGVSNYGIQHLEELEEFRRSSPALQRVPISVGQYEIHPWVARRELVAYLQKHNIAIQAFGPLVLGKHATDETLHRIAQKHRKQWSQVLLRWSLQKGYSPLPKSVSETRIAENADVYDFMLDDADLAALEMDAYEINRPGWDPITWGLDGPGW